MQYFKDDKMLYKQRTLSYMYWRMKSIFYGKNALFIRYVNETYNDLTPLKKVLKESYAVLRIVIHLSLARKRPQSIAYVGNIPPTSHANAPSSCQATK